MAICSRCGGAVSDGAAQPDAEGRLLCKACAGAWRHKSAQMTQPSQAAAPRTRSAGGAGVWKALTLIGGAAALGLLIVTVSLNSSRSKLQADNVTLTAQKTQAETDLAATRQELGSARDALVDRDNLLGRREAELRQLKQRMAALQVELEAAKQPPPPPPPKPEPKPEPPVATGPATGGQPGSAVKLFVWKTDATRYHVAGCRVLVKRENVPVTLEEAKKRKLVPCPGCKPPAQ